MSSKRKGCRFMNEKVLVVIPAYNEEKSIQRVVNELIANLPQYDYVVVNDGSKDNTAKVCLDNNFNILDLPVNLGLAGAFQTGLKYAYIEGYDYALQFDADGQHQSKYIPVLVDEIEKGYDIVIGSRFVTEKKPFTARMLGSHLIAFAMKLTTRKKVKDPTSGMRIFNRRMIREFALNINYGPEPDTISYLIKHGATVSEVQVEMAERTEGESYLNFSKSILYMLRMGISILLIQWFRKRNLEKIEPQLEGGSKR